jgi:hypothetical protein
MAASSGKRKRGATDNVEPIGAVFKRVATTVSGPEPDDHSKPYGNGTSSSSSTTASHSYPPPQASMPSKSSTNAHTPAAGFASGSPASGSSSSGDAFDFGADEETTRLLLGMGLMGQPSGEADNDNVLPAFVTPLGGPPNLADLSLSGGLGNLDSNAAGGVLGMRSVLFFSVSSLKYGV